MRRSDLRTCVRNISVSVIETSEMFGCIVETENDLLLSIPRDCNVRVAECPFLICLVPDCFNTFIPLHPLSASYLIRCCLASSYTSFRGRQMKIYSFRFNCHSLILLGLIVILIFCNFMLCIFFMFLCKTFFRDTTP
jgi:hypothetical protein